MRGIADQIQASAELSAELISTCSAGLYQHAYQHADQHVVHGAEPHSWPRIPTICDDLGLGFFHVFTCRHLKLRHPHGGVWAVEREAEVSECQLVNR